MHAPARQAAVRHVPSRAVRPCARSGIAVARADAGSCSRCCRSRSRRRRSRSMFATLRSRSAPGDFGLHACCRFRPSRSTDAPPRCRAPRIRRWPATPWAASVFSAHAGASRRRGRRPEAARVRRRAEIERGEILRDVPRERRDARGLPSIGRIVAQHVAIVLDGCAAARRRDQDCIEAVRFDLARPGVDRWRAPAPAPVARAPCDAPARRSSPRRATHHLDAVPGQQPDRRLVDRGREHRPGHSPAAARRGRDARPAAGNTWRPPVRRCAAIRTARAAASRRGDRRPRHAEQRREQADRARRPRAGRAGSSVRIRQHAPPARARRQRSAQRPASRSPRYARGA